MTDTLSIGGRGSGRGRSRSNSNGSTTLANRDQFPSKLYEMLESVENLGFSHVVCWLPHGESFKVVDPTQFMDLVVPKFFKATKYRSFQRQLNLWGFKRIVKGQDTACWQHEYFKRESPHLISKISRTRVKVRGRRSSTEAAEKPLPMQMQTHSDDSLEGASDCNENEGVHYFPSGRYISRQVSDNSCFAPELFKDEFDEKVSSMFSERSQSRSRITDWSRGTGYASLDETKPEPLPIDSERPLSRSRSIGFASLDEMRLEPLPIDSVGILDSPCNRNKIDLDDFGQLLGRLI